MSVNDVLRTIVFPHASQRPLLSESAWVALSGLHDGEPNDVTRIRQQLEQSPTRLLSESLGTSLLWLRLTDESDVTQLQVSQKSRRDATRLARLERSNALRASKLQESCAECQNQRQASSSHSTESNGRFVATGLDESAMKTFQKLVEFSGKLPARTLNPPPGDTHWPSSVNASLNSWATAELVLEHWRISHSVLPVPTEVSSKVHTQSGGLRECLVEQRTRIRNWIQFKNWQRAAGQCLDSDLSRDLGNWLEHTGNEPLLRPLSWYFRTWLGETLAKDRSDHSRINKDVVLLQLFEIPLPLRQPLWRLFVLASWREWPALAERCLSKDSLLALTTPKLWKACSGSRLLSKLSSLILEASLSVTSERRRSLRDHLLVLADHSETIAQCLQAVVAEVTATHNALRP